MAVKSVNQYTTHCHQHVCSHVINLDAPLGYFSCRLRDIVLWYVYEHDSCANLHIQYKMHRTLGSWPSMWFRTQVLCVSLVNTTRRTTTLRINRGNRNTAYLVCIKFRIQIDLTFVEFPETYESSMVYWFIWASLKIHTSCLKVLLIKELQCRNWRLRQE